MHSESLTARLMAADRAHRRYRPEQGVSGSERAGAQLDQAVTTSMATGTPLVSTSKTAER